MVKKQKPLHTQKRSSFRIILFRQENGTWKLKETAHFKKSRGEIIAPFHYYLN